MRLEILNYLMLVKIRASMMRQERDLKRMLKHPLSAIVLSLVRYVGKVIRFVLNRRRVRPGPVSQAKADPSAFRLFDESGEGVFRVERRRADQLEERARAGRPWPLGTRALVHSSNKKLVIVHAFFPEEAEVIFRRLQGFPDYDVALTTPSIRIIELMRRYLPASRSVGFLVDNHGRDVLPFLLTLAFLDIRKYEGFVKVHTKRSLHLSEGAAWFFENIESLIGQNEVTDGLLALVSADADAPSIYGCDVLPIGRGFARNGPWLESLGRQHGLNMDGAFIPGTMFLGSRRFLEEVAKLELHRWSFEEEHRQLDGTLAHALERYFGQIARATGGRCASLLDLLGSRTTTERGA